MRLISFLGIADLKFKTPSAIQMQAIPAGLQKRDLMGTAETGSGKTAAFSLPILVHVRYLQKANASKAFCNIFLFSKLPSTTGDDGPYAVIMAPTRELAVQIEDKIIDFAKYAPTKIRTACLIGGVSINLTGVTFTDLPSVNFKIGTKASQRAIIS